MIMSLGDQSSVLQLTFNSDKDLTLTNIQVNFTLEPQRFMHISGAHPIPISNGLLQDYVSFS